MCSLSFALSALAAPLAHYTFAPHYNTQRETFSSYSRFTYMPDQGQFPSKHTMPTSCHSSNNLYLAQHDTLQLHTVVGRYMMQDNTVLYHTRDAPKANSSTYSYTSSQTLHPAYNCCSLVHSYKVTCPRTPHPHTFHQQSIHTCNPEFTNPTLPPTSLVILTSS